MTQKQKNIFVRLRVLRVLRVFVVTSLFIVACKRDDMADQPRLKPLAQSPFFANNAGSRSPPEHTLPIDAPLQPDPASWLNPNTATSFPFPITRADLLRGQEQFNISCLPCHGALGDGDGMIPQRGFTRPPSYHTDRLRTAPPSYFYNVITLGIGAMFPQAERVQPDDRWRIAAYIRALQLSQNPATQPATQPGGNP